MFENIPMLSLITFSPLIGVLILLFVPKDQGKWIKIIAIGATLIPLILCAALYASFSTQDSGWQYAEEYNWIQIPLSQESQSLMNFTSYFYEFNFSLAVDGLSMPLIFLTALISAMAALAAVHIKKRWKSFFILFLLLEVGMFGVFLSKDLFLFFLFFEITLVPTFFLIGIWGYRNRESAANKFLVYNGFGSAIMLIAFLILVNTAGFSIVQDNAQTAYVYYSGDIETISNNMTDSQSYANLPADLAPNVPNPFHLGDTLKWALFIMMLVAFGVKLPIFPFHTWMLKVHTEAPPPIVMIHSGILLKMGAYGLIRFGVLLFPEQAKAWAAILAILGVVNILYGAILAVIQKEFRLVLAYSSISHMGIVLLGIAALNVTGMQGAIFQLISHGLISALMFLIVGSIYERTETTELGKLGGLAKSMPFIGGVLMLSGMASLGLPGLSGFISEFLAFLGLFEVMPVITVIGIIGIIITAVYVLRAILAITYGPGKDQYNHLKDARLIEAVPMIILAAFIILLGVYPAILNETLFATVNTMIENMTLRMGG